MREDEHPWKASSSLGCNHSLLGQGGAGWGGARQGGPVAEEGEGLVCKRKDHRTVPSSLECNHAVVGQGGVGRGRGVIASGGVGAEATAARRLQAADLSARRPPPYDS